MEKIAGALERLFSLKHQRLRHESQPPSRANT